VRFSFWDDGDCNNLYNAFDAGAGAVVQQWTHWAATYEVGRRVQGLGFRVLEIRRSGL
jgi:hypothetical protein